MSSRFFAAWIALAWPLHGFAAGDSLPEVRPANLSKLSPAAFTDEELDLPYYLTHLHTVANAVEASGPSRGFIHLNVWRRSDKAYNARVQENILSLAWFYCADRPWNPYHGDPALRGRLEAALDFWCREQRPDGQFAQEEGSSGDLAATAFATKFVGEALRLLKTGPPIDPAIFARAEAADRKAILAVLTIPGLYTYGCSYENQFGGIWVGAVTWLTFHNDPEVRALWESLFKKSRADLQSPAGYYYEKRGPDFEYTLDTHGHNSRQIWPSLRGSALGQELISRDTAWFDWLACNALPEPGGAGFILNRAIETRQPLGFFTTYETPLGEAIPLVRAFSETAEERATRNRRKRAALVSTWPKVLPLELGKMTAYSPYAFLHRRYPEWLPTTAQRDAARALLPGNARDHFTQQRRDSRQKIVYTFARRPAYYAAFTSGPLVTKWQRYGLGLLWSPALGTVLQSQTNSDIAAWGTQPAAAGPVAEAEGMMATFTLSRKALPEPAVGIHDLPAGEVAAKYSLPGGGEKLVTFGEKSVAVAVQRAGELTEVLPLLVPEDGRLVPAPGVVTLETPRGTFRVAFDPTVSASIANPTESVLQKRLVTVTLHARDALKYTLEF